MTSRTTEPFAVQPGEAAPSPPVSVRRAALTWFAVSGLLVVVALVTLVAPSVAAPAPRVDVLRFVVLTLAAGFLAFAFGKERHVQAAEQRGLDERMLALSLSGRVDELTALLGVGRALSADLDLGEVLDHVLGSALDQMEGVSGSVMLRDGDVLHVAVACGNAAAVGGGMRIGEGIAGRVAANAHPMLVTGSLDPLLVPGGVERTTPVECALSVPVARDGAVIGVLNVNAAVGHSYDDHDLRALAMFAEQAAGPILVAQAFEAEHGHLASLAKEAARDSLTGLANQALFRIRLGEALDSRLVGEIAVLFVDLEGVAPVNDALGHSAGDDLLRQVGARFRERLARPSVLPARLGGDEFAVLVTDLDDAEDAVETARAVLEVLDDPFDVEGLEVGLGASVGIAYRTETASAEDLLRNADVAMYVGRRQGRAGYTVYEPRMRLDGREALALGHDLSAAVDADELEVHYQPIVEMTSGRVVAAEALMRWRRPGHGLLRACEFIDAPVEPDVARALDRWLIERACHQARRWQFSHPDRTGTAVSVNLSAASVADPAVVDEIRVALEQAMLPLHLFVVEVSEAVVAAAPTAARLHLGRLREHGIRVALDDFGSGRGSLAGLHDIPADIVKLDDTLVRLVADGPDAAAVTESVVALGHRLGREVVAEGVECEQQRNRLLSLGCRLGQGYWYARPMTAEALDVVIGRGLETRTVELT